MQFLLTGARGYIGSHLLGTLLQQAHAVRILGSAPQTAPAGVVAVPWRLGDDIPQGAFDVDAGHSAIDAVIHLAHDWNTAEGDRETNQIGTAKLLAAARAAGVKRLVYVSSMSARSGALNRYGRIKFAIEGLLRAPNEVSARIGLVYGGAPLGLYGTLIRLTGLSPVLPAIDADQQVQPIHIDEVCLGLIRLAVRPELNRPNYGLASNTPLRFGTFLKLLAWRWHRRRIAICPISRWLALRLAVLSAYLPGLPTIGRERVLGLAGLTTRPTAADLQDIGMAVRSVEERLEPRRREHIAEAKVLMRYCAGARVGNVGVKLYVRYLERAGDNVPLRLPRLARRWPPLLRLFEPVRRADSLLRRRMILAARIAEAVPGPAERFYLLRQQSRLLLLVQLSSLALVEGLAFCSRALRRIAVR